MDLQISGMGALGPVVALCSTAARRELTRLPISKFENGRTEKSARALTRQNDLFGLSPTFGGVGVGGVEEGPRLGAE